MAIIKPEAVAFDWDGVLFDSSRSHHAVRGELARIFGVEFGNFGGRETLDCLRELGCSRDFIERYYKTWEGLEDREAPRVFRVANKTLKRLRSAGMITGVVTNRRKSRHNIGIMKRSGIDFTLIDFFVMREAEYFEWHARGAAFQSFLALLRQLNGWLSGPRFKTTVHSKPDRRTAGSVIGELEKLNNYPHSVWYVGDNIIDLEFARAVGWKFAGVSAGSWDRTELFEELGADIIVNDVGEITQELLCGSSR